MIDEIFNPDEIRAADIVVGIPSYNEADTISTPVSIKITTCTSTTNHT